MPDSGVDPVLCFVCKGPALVGNQVVILVKNGEEAVRVRGRPPLAGVAASSETGCDAVKERRRRLTPDGSPAPG